MCMAWVPTGRALKRMAVGAGGGSDGKSSSRKAAGLGMSQVQVETSLPSTEMGLQCFRARPEAPGRVLGISRLSSLTSDIEES